MTVIRKSKRSSKAAKRFDPSDLRELLRDRRVWAEIGKVVVPEGESSHFELIEEDGAIVEVLVSVETQPEEVSLQCCLGSSSGGVGIGLWQIPPVDSDVLVMVPAGDITFCPAIVAVLGSGNVPDRVADGRAVLVASSEVEIIAPTVRLAEDPSGLNALDGVVTGRGVDSFTGSTYAALGNASGKVLAEK